MASGGVGQAADGSVKSTPSSLDSQSAQDLAVNPMFHTRSKHMAFKFYWVRDHVDPDGECGTVSLIHVRTND